MEPGDGPSNIFNELGAFREPQPSGTSEIVSRFLEALDEDPQPSDASEKVSTFLEELDEKEG